jgi:hypothetical protein
MVFHWTNKPRAKPIQNWPPLRNWIKSLAYGGITLGIGYIIYSVNMIYAEKNLREVRTDFVSVRWPAFFDYFCPRASFREESQMRMLFP